MITPRSDFPALTIDAESPLPVFRQLHRRITEAVLDGRLAPGTRLPSARSLAAHLSIARGTVEAAYQLLAGEGYIVTRGAGGTLIDPALARDVLRPKPAVSGKALPLPAPREGKPALFQMGLPALDVFPAKIWARLVSRQARATTAVDLTYQPGAGHPELRTQIARYLAVARGVACEPSEIFVTSGYQGALGLIARALMRPGDGVWMEHPAYPIGCEALRLAGARLIGVPVDAEGFDVAWARSKAEPAKWALVTPTHQYPLGRTLSLQRRMALLTWAEDAAGWIIEDDYDSEYRYEGRPLLALKSLDRRGRVLFVGTFSKVLSPGLRVGYLVVPPDLAPRFAEIANALQPPPVALIQAAIAAFIDRGYLGRHIRRMRALYGERRAALAVALHRHVRPALTIELQAGGMHLLARLPRGADDRKLVAALADQGIAVSPLSGCGVDAPYDPGLLIGFTNVATDKAGAAARRLREGLRQAGLRTSSG